MEHFDVVIVGAGISGIGSAAHLKEQCPTKRFVILEARDAIGGTWDLFRYPGIRSDSDMHTMGFSFKPWEDPKAIADGPAILSYVNEAAAERDIVPHIRFKHRVTSASWSTPEARWTVQATNGGSEEPKVFTCNVLVMCSGYYNYEQPYDPGFKDVDLYRGTLVHPQFWPKDLDYKGQRVLVIGSGATAMTVVPSMAKEAAHVTMLQRSPTYVISRPAEDWIANLLRKILPSRLAYRLTRWKNVRLQRTFYGKTRTRPAMVRKKLLDLVRKQLIPGYDVETHFTPSYNPWDERLCLLPDGDLFDVINAGKASVVTAELERFTEKGVRLKSGEELEADIVVTATGLQLLVLGGTQFSVDGKAIDFPETLTYKGMMYSDVPNLIQTFGYINASWTLRADLTAEYSCRVINRMDELGARICVPRLRDEDRNMETRPWIVDFTPGYMQRVMHLFPKQGDHEPWLNTQNYARDRKMIRHAPLEDGALRFENPTAETQS